VALAIRAIKAFIGLLRIIGGCTGIQAMYNHHTAIQEPPTPSLFGVFLSKVERAVCPASGARWQDSGGFSATGNYGYYWTGINNRYMPFDGGVYLSGNVATAYTFAIRCLSK
jgi:hypothetical protein